MYSFLEFSISKAAQYPDVLERVKKGDTLLDLACCFGQDVRKMVYDGAPAENVTGTELEPQFIDYGYELFNDREKLESKFVACDFFSETPDLKEHSFDIIQAASFFHLFTWDENMEAMSKAIGLLKPKAGSMIFGRQTGVEEPGEMKVPGLRSGAMYRHNPESFKRLVANVGEKTSTKLQVEVEVDKNKRWDGDDKMRMIRFCITMQ